MKISIGSVMSNTKPSQLGNKYIFLNLIGVGGMAEVYKCKLSGQKGFEKIVALKKLLPQVAQDDAIVENFIDEARIAALLQHENIVHIYDFGELDGSYFIAMEYLFGKDLYSIIQRSKETGNPIGIENSLLIASKICEGMQYAHDLRDLQQHPLNIIHRDLSPHNVFVTYDGKIKIIDFGIAKAELYDNRTKAGVIKGKISYMSPEQLCEQQIDLRSDIFSIGILLYEMLSGQRMFQGDTASLIRKCMQVDYENIEIVKPGLFPQIYEIVNKALQKDRTRRYQTCAEMHEAIENCFIAMRRRPKTENLQNLVRQLFKEHFENDRKILVTAIERSDEVYLRDKKQTAVIVNDEGTLVLDSNNITASFPGSLFQKFFSSAAKTFRRMTLIGFIVCLTTFFIYLNLSSKKSELNSEDSKKSEITGLPLIETAEENVPDLSPQFHQVLVVKPEEKETSPQQREINSLLDKADTAYNYKRLTVPDGDSAFTYYKKVLDISPANDAALDGLQKISDKYAEYAEKELSNKKIMEAQRNIQRGLAVNPQNDRLLKLSARAEKEKGMLVEELARKAQHSIEIDNLTSPKMDCAYKYYQDIRILDHDSVIVVNGIKKIANRYADLAEDSYRNLNLANASEFVKKGLKVQSDHDRLLVLQEDLSLSKPGIFFKMLQKNIKSAIDLK